MCVPITLLSIKYLDIIIGRLYIVPCVLAQICQPQVCQLPAPRGLQAEHVPVSRHDAGDAISGHPPTEGGPQHVAGGWVETQTVIGVGLLQHFM